MFVATDLHGHTHFSDGRATPEEYAAFRARLGMKVIAVSDHDVLTAVRPAAIAAQSYGMKLLPAMEATSFIHFGTDRCEQIHILAYWPARMALDGTLEKTVLFRRGQRLQELWRVFVLEWLDTLSQDDRNAIDPGRLLERFPAERFPALQSMIDRIVLRRRELFETFRKHHIGFWEGGRELFSWSPEELIDVIRADGAVDIVAHPVRYLDKDRLAKVIEKAQGVEVYTSRHKAEVAQKFRALAEELGKLWTASSDDHQNARYMKPPCGTPVTTLTRLAGEALPAEWSVPESSFAEVAAAS